MEMTRSGDMFQKTSGALTTREAYCETGGRRGTQQEGEWIITTSPFWFRVVTLSLTMP